MLPDQHLSGVTPPKETPNKSKAVLCLQSNVHKSSIRRALSGKWTQDCSIEGAPFTRYGSVRWMIITSLKLITGDSTTNCERVLQSRLSKTYCWRGGVGWGEMQWI
jgi:hypothetical protein